MRPTGVEVRLIDYTANCLDLVAASAKLSATGMPYSDIKRTLTLGEAARWARLVIMRSYTSVLEHCKYTFEVVCSRVCSHQLVRHRIASYTQQSLRWTDEQLRRAAAKACSIVGGECSINPSSRDEYMSYVFALDELADLIEHDERAFDKAIEVVATAFVIPPFDEEDKLHEYVYIHLKALSSYWWLRFLGARPEDARYALPSSVKTRIIVTMNARELIDVFLPLRLCKRAQWEIREVAAQMLAILQGLEPWIFDYAGPRCLRVAQLAGAECTLEDLAKGRCSLPIERCPEGVDREKIPSCVKPLYERLLDLHPQ